MQNSATLFSNSHDLPLAEALRPKKIEDFLGQNHITDESSAITNLINAKKSFSTILWGPPGCGKTTFANLLANKFDAHFSQISAVDSSVKELKILIKEAKNRLELQQQKTIIFIDEIHRYTKTQQDVLLPYLEQGIIYLIGATTENPSFQVIPALLSRVQVITLEPVSKQNILKIVKKGYAYLMNKYGKINIDSAIGEFIVNYAAGDVRSALNLVENSYFASKPNGDKKHLSLDIIENLAQKQHLRLSTDQHYNYASAFQKSIRGSDANAAIYWLAHMISAGEDPRFIARRLIVTASEDIGIADPNALNIAVNAYRAVELIGLPEGRIPLADATIYLAKAKKSNKAYKAVDKALADIERNGKNYPVPNHLRDAHYADAEKYGAGVGYIYSHNAPDLEQNFLPEELRDINYLED